jgi:hypothetical protein
MLWGLSTKFLGDTGRMGECAGGASRGVRSLWSLTAGNYVRASFLQVSLRDGAESTLPMARNHNLMRSPIDEALTWFAN